MDLGRERSVYINVGTLDDGRSSSPREVYHFAWEANPSESNSLIEFLNVVISDASNSKLGTPKRVYGNTGRPSEVHLSYVHHELCHAWKVFIPRSPSLSPLHA